MHPETPALRKQYNPAGSTLRKLQLELLDILIVVTDICDRHGIRYWLSGGTLLGAVVHGGFIPWDDDIDMELPRKDYRKLMKILPRELPPNLYLDTSKNKNFRHKYAKVKDKNSIVYEQWPGEPIMATGGFFVDIVPVDACYPYWKRKVESNYGMAFNHFRSLRPTRSIRKLVKLWSKYVYGILLRSVSQCVSAIGKPHTVYYGYGIDAAHAQHVHDLLPVSRIEFEGRMFSAPADPHRYLMAQYRCDYTIIPPPEGRPQHIVKFEYL